MNKTTLRFSLPLAGAALLLAPLSVSAQFGGAKVATVGASAKPAAIVRGGRGLLLVMLSVKPKYHVNANKPNDPAYIPTVFTVQPMPGFSFGAARYPSAQLVKVSYSPKPLLVYRGQVVITVPFTVTKAVGSGVKRLTGLVSYQGCDANSCFPPATATVKASVLIR